MKLWATELSSLNINTVKHSDYYLFHLPGLLLAFSLDISWGDIFTY